MSENLRKPRRVITATVERLENVLDLFSSQSVKGRHKRIKFCFQVGSLVILDRPKLDADSLGPIGITLVHGGERPGNRHDSHAMWIVSSGSRERHSVKELKGHVQFDNPSRVPVKNHA